MWSGSEDDDENCCEGDDVKRPLFLLLLDSDVLDFLKTLPNRTILEVVLVDGRQKR